jgi:hypothetical protein
MDMRATWSLEKYEKYVEKKIESVFMQAEYFCC